MGEALLIKQSNVSGIRVENKLQVKIITSNMDFVAPGGNISVRLFGGGAGCYYRDEEISMGGGSGYMNYGTFDIKEGTSIPVTIGAGGNGIFGNSGGVTSFGTYISANGGSYANGGAGGGSAYSKGGDAQYGGGGGGAVTRSGESWAYVYGGGGGNGGTHGGGGGIIPMYDNGYKWLNGVGGQYGGNAGQNGTSAPGTTLEDGTVLPSMSGLCRSPGNNRYGGGGYGGWGGTPGGNTSYPNGTRDFAPGGGGGYYANGGNGAKVFSIGEDDYFNGCGAGGGGGWGCDGTDARGVRSGGGGGYGKAGYASGGTDTINSKNGISGGGNHGICIITYYKKEIVID